MKKIIPSLLLVGALTSTSSAAITVLNGDFSDAADLAAVPNDGDTALATAASWSELVSGGSQLVNKSGDVETRLRISGRGILQNIRQESNTALVHTFAIGDIVEISFDADLVNDGALTSIDIQLFGGTTDVSNVAISADGSFSTQITVTSAATKQLRIRNGSNNDVDIDNLSVSIASVPEPSSFALLGLGGLGLLVRRRK